MIRVLVFALAVPILLTAGTVFSDGFESKAAGLNVTPTGWTITNGGTVDVIGFGCHSGSQCVDLDGSTNLAAVLAHSFSAVNGVGYSLSFWLNNSQRGSNETVAGPNERDSLLAQRGNEKLDVEIADQSFGG